MVQENICFRLLPCPSSDRMHRTVHPPYHQSPGHLHFLPPPLHVQACLCLSLPGSRWDHLLPVIVYTFSWMYSSNDRSSHSECWRVGQGCILCSTGVPLLKSNNSQLQHGDFDYDQHLTIGYSTRLAQVHKFHMLFIQYFLQSVVVLCGLAFLAFIFGSHKQKGEHAATMDLEIEDRPVHIGRL